MMISLVPPGVEGANVVSLSAMAFSKRSILVATTHQACGVKLAVAQKRLVWIIGDEDGPNFIGVVFMTNMTDGSYERRRNRNRRHSSIVGCEEAHQANAGVK